MGKPPYRLKQTWKFIVTLHFCSPAAAYNRCIISEINIVYCIVHVTLSSANVEALSYIQLNSGTVIIFCPPAILPSPSSPVRTLELIVCLILKNIMAQKKRQYKQKVGWFLRGGRGGEAAVEEPFLAPHLIEKHYTLSAAGTA